MKQAEITWSLMHPTAIDIDYMRRVAALAADSDVQSFEICGACHARRGGLDGLIDYVEYPQVAAAVDQTEVAQRIAGLKSIVDIAHKINKPLFYWHREVVIEAAMRQEFPDLLDENGECNLLGPEFEHFLRYKLEKTFAAVPELDGVVLTLTEADFSVIHNSNTRKYPPAEVVRKIAAVFAEEHYKRNKRFILRSFGSIAEDYESILAGAAAAAADWHFEIETKITPYDFNPFFPENPFLRQIDNLELAAECDCLGEFLGAGLLPAENIENIVKYVRIAQRAGVNRYALRLDRVGNNIFDSYPINLYAYTQAIRNWDLTAEDIEKSYAQKFEPAECGKQLRELGRLGLDATLKTNYINHQLVFHSFPPPVDLKWLKAGGIFAIFKNGVTPSELDGIWSILTDRPNPDHAEIMAEKALALAQAQQGLKQVEVMRNMLPANEYDRLQRLWNNAVIAAQTMLDWVRGVIGYFQDMANLDPAMPSLMAAIRQMEADFPEFIPATDGSPQKFVNGLDHSLFSLHSAYAAAVYPGAMLGNLYLLKQEYAAELAARNFLQQECPEAYDTAIAGAISDDWRFGRFMHASHALIHNERPARLVGNTIFPNGFVRVNMHGAGGQGRLRIYGQGAFKVEVNGSVHELTAGEFAEIQVDNTRDVGVKVFRGAGTEFPILHALVLLP